MLQNTANLTCFCVSFVELMSCFKQTMLSFPSFSWVPDAQFSLPHNIWRSRDIYFHFMLPRSDFRCFLNSRFVRNGSLRPRHTHTCVSTQTTTNASFHAKAVQSRADLDIPESCLTITFISKVLFVFFCPSGSFLDFVQIVVQRLRAKRFFSLKSAFGCIFILRRSIRFFFNKPT